jgi:hypothetical protein
MAKKPSKKRAPEVFIEPESDEHFAYIAGYTSGGAPYGITWEEQEENEHRAPAKNSASPPEQTVFSLRMRHKRGSGQFFY